VAPQSTDEARFLTAWAALPRMQRSHLRRLVRMGMPVGDREQAEVAVAYAQFQRGRLWARIFWFWFVPGLILALGVATQIHPVLVGVVLVLAAQAVFARRNLGRVERVNAATLAGGG